MKLVAVILTFNEEIHLERCITSVREITSEIVVADCFSTDATLVIARFHGARVIQRAWVNYATQFNWALTQLDADTDWVLRIDADEYLTPEFVAEIKAGLPGIGSAIDGVYCSRRMTFQGRLICHGGVFPVRVLRLFRYGRGQCENRWMDEHIKVRGPTVDFKGELIDDNLNTLTWWTDKHNKYASREAVDLLNLEYGFMPHDTVASLRGGSQAGVKRWLKEEVYARLPGGFRAFAYFFYRYVIRLGFLDGQAGTAFHFLQGFWYRYLVDAKVAEVKRFMKNHDCSVLDAIDRVLGIKVLVAPVYELQQPPDQQP
jgi:glycosyltransferase involved in cell wall biosynthesis